METSGNYNVLIVDDDLEVCSLIQDYLTRIPNIKNVVLAHDGMNALVKLKNQKFDLITLDMKMPRLAGYDILSEIAADKLNSIDNILVISGSLDQTILKLATSNGVKNFLVKPFDEISFKGKALKILSKKTS